MSGATLDHVRWIGGGSGAGKSTLASALARTFGLGVYSTDEAIAEHSGRLGPEAPLLQEFQRMSMDERWMLRDPATMYRTFPWFHGEGFDLLVEDLLALPRASVTLVEGFRLLPQLVLPLLTDLRHGVWLFPTKAFRQAAFTARDGDAAFWTRTTDPDRALTNLLERDRMFSNAILAETTRFGLNAVPVDGTTSIDDQAVRLAAALSLG